MEPLALLPAKSMEGITQSIEEFRFVFCLQDHVHSIVSGHILCFSVRRKHPKLGLSTCSKHVALVTELECT